MDTAAPRATSCLKRCRDMKCVERAEGIAFGNGSSALDSVLPKREKGKRREDLFVGEGQQRVPVPLWNFAIVPPLEDGSVNLERGEN
jgi:hypothetical protein